MRAKGVRKCREEKIGGDAITKGESGRPAESSLSPRKFVPSLTAIPYTAGLPLDQPGQAQPPGNPACGTSPAQPAWSADAYPVEAANNPMNWRTAPPAPPEPYRPSRRETSDAHKGVSSRTRLPAETDAIPHSRRVVPRPSPGAACLLAVRKLREVLRAGPRASERGIAVGSRPDIRETGYEPVRFAPRSPLPRSRSSYTVHFKNQLATGSHGFLKTRSRFISVRTLRICRFVGAQN